MQIKIFTITALFLALGVPGLFASASAGDYNAGSYLFHLYYNNGTLVADRDFQFKYDVSSDPYVQPALTVQFPYHGEVVNLAGEVAIRFTFDPRQGDNKLTKGKVTVQAPYVADGQRVAFYDFQNNPILTVPVSDSSFCNDDGVCNTDRGEDSTTCPKDCKNTLPAPPASGTATTTTTSAGSSGVVSGLIFAFVGVALIGGVWWYFKKRGSMNQSLPTPPTPPGPQNTP